MKHTIKKLLFYALLLALIPFSAKAIQISIDELRDMFSGEQSLGASILYPYQGGTGQGTAEVGDVGKYLKVSGNSPFTFSFDTPAGGGSGGITYNYLSQIGDVSTTTLATGYTLAYDSNNNWTSTSTLFIDESGKVGIGTTSPAYKLDVYGNARIDGTLKVGAYTLPSTDGTANYVLKTDGSGALTWQADNDTGGASSIASLNAQFTDETVASTTHIWDDAYVSNTLTVDGYMQDTDIDTFAELQSWAIGYTDNNTTYVSSDFTHDDLTGYVANEHLDWTSDLGATNIHSGNYTTLTNLTDFDQTAWRLFYSNNLGDVIELSLGTDGQYLQSQGGTASLTWSVPTDNNTTYTGGTGITLTGTVFSTTDSEIVHDNLSGFVANEHIDWTADQGATNIHAGNYTDNDTITNESISLSGDITGSGATAITTTIGSNKILESMLKSVNAPTDEYVLTYESTTGDFEWEVDQTGAGGSGSMTTVKENGSQIGGADIVTLDFLGADFNLTETPDTEINITINDGGIDHDSLLNYVANEHLDWTSDLGAVNIHSGNYTDTNTNANTICSGGTTYMDGDGNCDDISSVYQALDAQLTDLADGTLTGNFVNTANPWADNEVSNTLTVIGYMQDTDIDTFAELQSWAVGYTDNDTTYTGGTNLTLAGTEFSVDDSFMTKTGAKIWSTTIASTSPAFIGSGLLPIPPIADGYTITHIECRVMGGTNKVIAIEDASGNSTENITCLATVTDDDGSITNATYTASEISYIDFGATSGEVNYVMISVFGTY